MAEFGFTQSELKDILSYDPLTGKFVWVKPHPSKPYLLGKEAGTRTEAGYIYIRLLGEGHMASRLAWFYTTGKEPEGEVDHRNRIRSDNRWENLRESTSSENQHNRAFGGVFWMKGKRHWRVSLKLENKAQYIGSSKCFGQAVKMRNSAKRQLHPTSPL